MSELRSRCEGWSRKGQGRDEGWSRRDRAGVRGDQVNPAWQRQGLGRGAVERLTARLLKEGITTITLYAEPGVVGLYQKLGFVRDPDGIRGMAFQRKSNAGAALIAAQL
jgi:GNAT superfamily N-acetyltransferase